MPTFLQRPAQPRKDWTMPRGEFANPAGPARGASNWGAGAQPNRAPASGGYALPAEVNPRPSYAAPTPSGGGRNLGTMTTRDLSRGILASSVGQRATTTGTRPTSGYNETSSNRPRTSYADFLSNNPNSPAATGSLAASTPAPLAATRPSYANAAPYQPGGFDAQNAQNNAGVYAPGSFGAQNAAANGTGYRAPQQTERANPLSGDNDYPIEGQSVVARPPFIQRGGGVPGGRDVPAPIRQTLTEDNDIGRSIVGTQNRISPGFASRATGAPSERMMRQLFQ